MRELKSKERIIKEIVVESSNLLELVQWNDQKEDLPKMYEILTRLENKCHELKEELGQ